MKKIEKKKKKKENEGRYEHILFWLLFFWLLNDLLYSF